MVLRAQPIRLIPSIQLQLLDAPVDIEFELRVVRIAEDQCGSVSDVEDARVRHALLLQMSCPPLEFIHIRDPERQVIQADTAFVERPNSAVDL